MRIHREGIKTLTAFVLLLFILNLAVYLIPLPALINYLIIGSSLAGLVFVSWFFRNPRRPVPENSESIIAPADGTIISVEELFEEEFFSDYRIRISIFMSGNNVHVNWIPVSGYVRYHKYNPGRHLFARHPKSSNKNERSTVLIEDKKGRQLMLRQIAGIMARRVVTYPRPGEEVKTGDELGFIKFGSRVDIFLPKEAKVYVTPGQKTTGRVTEIAGWEE
jgi:phosphatidylserine decarboxylase